MALQGGQGAVGDLDQENQLAFAQRKLEDNYSKVYRQLNQWRGALEIVQEVLVWKRPIPAAFLYLAVHWVFYYLATNNEGFLSQLSTLLFWMLVGDAIWRAATRDGHGLQPDSSRSGARVVRRTRQREVSDVVSFERALLLTYEPRSHQLVPYEVVCLTVAKWWMDLDNLWLAMRHWSTHDPIMFCMSLAVPGLILAVIGKYIPTLVLLYILVMGGIVWPYIQYHNLLQRAVVLFTTHFPVLIQRTESWWQLMKTLFTRDESALSEFSLVGDGDVNQTQELLGDEFDQFIGQREVEEGSKGGRQEREGMRVSATPGKRVDPGMSVLQDSVLGMTADAFHDVEDSLASFGPGTGEFPSISNFDDHSLTLPQFPPESVNQQSVSPHLATIQELEEVGLDNSVELEYGLNQQTVLRHRSASQQEAIPQRTHPLAEYSTSVPITDSPHYPLEVKGESFGRRTPPPPYDVVVTHDTKYQNIYPKLEEDLSHQQGMPKSSSTPLPHGYQ